MPRTMNLLVATLLGLTCALIPAPAVADGSARDALFNAYQKMINSSYVADTVSTDAKGKQTRSTVKFENIHRFRSDSDGASIIVLPDATWMRTGGGEWMKPPVDISAMTKNLIPSTVDDIRKGTTNIKDEGMQTVDGKSVHVISHEVNTKIMGMTISSQNKVYIDNSGKIIRSESDSKVMGQKTHAVQNIRYDDSIRISAPN